MGRSHFPLASIITGYPGPTALRTAASRGAVLPNVGLADLHLESEESLRLNAQRVFEPVSCSLNPIHPPFVL